MAILFFQNALWWSTSQASVSFYYYFSQLNEGKSLWSENEDLFSPKTFIIQTTN